MHLAKNFLGTTSSQYQFDSFKLSLVDYNERVSEDWHFHDKVHVSAIIKGGNLESRKSKDIQVLPGSIMTYDQGEIHRNRHTAHPSRNLNIEFEDDFFKDEIHISQLKSDEPINIDFHNLYLELLLDDGQSKTAIEHLVTSLFWQDHYDSDGHWIPQLKQLLNDKWSEFPSLEHLSDQLNIHPVTISKYFAKKSGLTLSEYMRRLKVKRAIDMLINTSKSFAQIAFSCGYSDQSHMNRLVKRYTGYTPGEIRSLS